MKHVTLRDIAEKAGCTRAAVSYALKNSPKISVATRNRIHAIAGTLGWTPSPDLQQHMALTRATTGGAVRNNIAIILNKPKSELDKDPIPRRQFTGALRRAEQLGYSASVFNLADEPLSPKRLRGILRSRSIKGLVFMTVVGFEVGLEWLELGREFASSVIAIRYPKIGYHVAIADFLANGLIAMEELKKRGYRKVGVAIARGVDEPLDWAFSASLSGGHLKHYGKMLQNPYFGKQNVLRFLEEDRASFQTWFKEEKPDAILTTDILHLPEIMPDGARESVDIFDLGYEPSRRSCLGGLDQRYEMAGSAGVDLVVAQMHRGEWGVPEVQKSVQIVGRWVWNDSFLSPRRAKKAITRKR